MLLPNLCEECGFQLLGKEPYICYINIIKTEHFPYNNIEIILECPNCKWRQGKNIDEYFIIRSHQ